ncbi:hypothetical protein PHYPSEUDO_015214 [Phytophthora pseudosyringae]|uniref:Uncharacterized protein n=1 Tax=Phytophthora pseudosyringae TaxID=221518 RepID=A0A8T1VZJ2_9STRA|nr:hypothetical protein PHYPSEUDO_015214 [Phytophthora pseudosyringae]
MADASDDEADAMASVRMLYVVFTKLRQLAANGIPDSCAHVPRLPAALAEADRPFNQTYCNRHAKVFRDNYRVNHHVFDSLVEICDAQITEPVRRKRELLGVTLDAREQSKSQTLHIAIIPSLHRVVNAVPRLLLQALPRRTPSGCEH